MRLTSRYLMPQVDTLSNSSDVWPEPTPWNIDRVANGVYLYLVDLNGQKARGKIAVLKRNAR